MSIIAGEGYSLWYKRRCHDQLWEDRGTATSRCCSLSTLRFTSGLKFEMLSLYALIIMSFQVVNRLHKNYVHDTLLNYGVQYDNTWIYDKIHHKINQFCSFHSLQQVYIDVFDQVWMLPIYLYIIGSLPSFVTCSVLFFFALVV